MTTKKIENINTYIDHTVLKANATFIDVEKICDEAKKYNFASVCINPCFVEFAKQKLVNSTVKVCTVIGFPLGANTSKVKVLETKNAIKNGADEIDMVINIGKLLSSDFDYVLNEIKAIKKACKKRVLKVIIETALLDEGLIIKMCEIVNQSGADFIKTSTGFSTAGATVKDIKTMATHIIKPIGIKASGGISNYKDAVAMIEAGATRLGTSKGVIIVEGK